jgi:LmbE family N-acetylglucosaminyl deacetylase
MAIIRNNSTYYGMPETFRGATLSEAVAAMQAAIRACGPDFAQVIVTENDYDIIAPDWNATHRITFTPIESTTPQVWECMEHDGSLYTESEWEAHDAADWTIDEDRNIWWQGESFAPGPGNVRVDRL